MKLTTKIIFLILQISFSTILGEPKYTISEFDIQLMEQKINKNIVHSCACEVNNLGQVVGLCNVQENHWSKQSCAVYVWDQVKGFEVISLSDDNKRYPVINDNGIVAWTTYQAPSNPNGETICRAYLWDTKRSEIHSLGNNHSMVNAINNRNEILITPHNRELTTFLLTVGLENYPIIRSSTWGDIGSYFKNLMRNSLTERQNSCALNNLSQVAGRVFFVNQRNGSRASKGFLWSPNGIEDLGLNIDPNDINDEGKIVGCYHSAGLKPCAILLQEGEMMIIQQNARANKINNHGVIVGDLWTQGLYNEEKAFVYKEGVNYELFNLIVDNNNGWTALNNALDINDAGQIVGYGLRDGKITGFLLNPL
jgi:uncharacterized membrane protein